MDVYIARQPIFDENYNIFAYELLYRESEINSFAGNISDNVATSILLLNSYFSFGIDNLVGDSKAFINFDSHLIKLGVAELLNKDKVVIEILETVIPDRTLYSKLNHLIKIGYTIAIDDYTADYKYNNITDLCKIVKVDFMENTRKEIEAFVPELIKSGKLILAEKVETKEEFEWAKSLGFDYYQGYYFSKPKMEKQKTLTGSALQYVKLMNELNEVEPNFSSLSNIIMGDAALAYKLLKLVNSNVRLKSDIISIQQAIARLGVNEFKQWLSLAMVQNMSKVETNETIKYAMIRSNLLKEIALNSDLKGLYNELALLGILSVIDAILEMDMQVLLESLPISDEMKNTLLGKKTRYSDAYTMCILYEKAKFDEIQEIADKIKYDSKLLPDHYYSSVRWTENMMKELEGSN